ncbi:hypothetical protein [Methanimicrococcus hacksteinii]|nr:hypothetical protein [Methanimicrococcus sp. At1]
MKKLLELLLIITIPLAVIAFLTHSRKGGKCCLCGKKDKKDGKKKKHHLW